MSVPQRSSRLFRLPSQRLARALASAVVPVAFGAAAAALGAACQGGRSQLLVEPVPTGTLTVDFTIGDEADPAACERYEAEYVEIVVYDERGRPYTEALAACEDFTVRVDLPEGLYAADVTLVDRLENPVSAPVALDDVEIVEDTELAVDIVFPEP